MRDMDPDKLKLMEWVSGGRTMIWWWRMWWRHIIPILVFCSICSQPDGGQEEQHPGAFVLDAHGSVDGRQVAEVRDAHAGVQCGREEGLPQGVPGRASGQGKSFYFYCFLNRL